MNKRKYLITYTAYNVVEFDDEEMKKYGYEGEITEEMREEYLDNILVDEYPMPTEPADYKIEEIDGDNDNRVIRRVF